MNHLTTNRRIGVVESLHMRESCMAMRFGEFLVVSLFAFFDITYYSSHVKKTVTLSNINQHYREIDCSGTYYLSRTESLSALDSNLKERIANL